jgi:hypothetical protein
MQAPGIATFEAPAPKDNERSAVSDTPLGFNNPASALIEHQDNTTSDVTEYGSSTGEAQTSATDRKIRQNFESDQGPLLSFDNEQLEQAFADQ